MNEEYSYIFYTFFKNLQEMKEKPGWSLFEIYHMYEEGWQLVLRSCFEKYPANFYII